MHNGPGRQKERAGTRQPSTISIFDCGAGLYPSNSATTQGMSFSSIDRVQRDLQVSISGL
jgi:hypothetical protein